MTTQKSFKRIVRASPSAIVGKVSCLDQRLDHAAWSCPSTIEENRNERPFRASRFFRLEAARADQPL
jgi:hypothetical protein